MSDLARDLTAVALKEMKHLRRDPISLGLTIIFPILLIGLFISVFAALNVPSHNIAVVVADLDDSQASRILIDKLSISNEIRVAELLQTEEQALDQVKSGKIAGAVIIPRGFGEAFLTNEPPFVVLQTDNSRAGLASLIQSAVNRAAEQLPVGKLSGKTASVEVILRPISGRPLGQEDHILPSFLGIVIILGAFDDVVNAISREREHGTLPRLLLSPASILSVYMGKVSATVVLTLVRTSLVLIIFVLMGLVIHGNLLLIYVTTSLIAVFTLAVGLLISSRVRSSATLTILEIAMTFPLLQLAGIPRSTELLTSGGRTFARILPWTYGTEALRRIIYLGLGFDAVAVDLFVLFLSIAILLPIATVLFKRTM